MENNTQTTEEKLVLKMTGKVIALVKIIVILAAGNLALLAYFSQQVTLESEPEPGSDKKMTSQTPNKKESPFPAFDANFSIDGLGHNGADALIRYGHDIVMNTSSFIGPANPDPTKVYAGNNLSCKNCHLDGGTKPHAAPFVGIANRYPKYMSREDQVADLHQRVNGCMERSMNGRKFPPESKELKAIVAYMEWLSKDVPSTVSVQGRGFAEVKIPNRKVDLHKGKDLFAQKCASCHGSEGQGVSSGENQYSFPPLAGDDTYNNGAGMHRVLTAARFLKANMPLGATSENPILSDEEAYDLAGYINSLKHPKKSGLEKDFPDLKQKPVSTPYGPFPDHFSQEQHQYGPFPEIMAYHEKNFNLKKSK
ncbi:c-type cytochrome [bacterium SCSIO 12741]|nr:c-type cytochrome [bacterium SCSIO 12741]